jgi:hypothetical protein
MHFTWLYKLLNEEGVWQELILNEYLHSKTPSQVVSKLTILHFGRSF